MDLVGKSGGLLMGWGRDMTIHLIQLSDFCVEVKFEGIETNGRM